MRIISKSRTNALARLLAGVMLTAAFFATIIDGAGNVPFLRAVHPHEREAMTAVFTTFRHGTSLMTPGLFAIVLAFYPLPFVFVSAGLAFFVMTILASYVPRRL